MSYTPTIWANGDTITAAKMNKLESGLVSVEAAAAEAAAEAAEAASSGSLIVHENDNGQLDKTGREILDAFSNGKSVYVYNNYVENGAIVNANAIPLLSYSAGTPYLPWLDLGANLGYNYYFLGYKVCFGANQLDDYPSDIYLGEVGLGWSNEVLVVGRHFSTGNISQGVQNIMDFNGQIVLFDNYSKLDTDGTTIFWTLNSKQSCTITKEEAGVTVETNFCKITFSRVSKDGGVEVLVFSNEDNANTFKLIPGESGQVGIYPTITNPQDGDTLVYNATQQKWVNGAGAGGVVAIGTISNGTVTLDKTFNEIYNAFMGGRVVRIIAGNGEIQVCNIITIVNMPDQQIYGVAATNPDGLVLEFAAESPDSYLSAQLPDSPSTPY